MEVNLFLHSKDRADQALFQRSEGALQHTEVKFKQSNTQAYEKKEHTFWNFNFPFPLQSVSWHRNRTSS